ncbi:hypothetical protein KIN20_002057 [Parelaphostrongylus tenuis]|uniref:Uncharacterized protein n=1 Tax=Parelaphostrongylus tenuis TaxID=148309 RepID=A0AAD5QD96_PARTN|nr:hypothetical protein KIN20_002057 [Parelaphostrongylus tenuis]
MINNRKCCLCSRSRGPSQIVLRAVLVGQRLSARHRLAVAPITEMVYNKGPQMQKARLSAHLPHTAAHSKSWSCRSICSVSNTFSRECYQPLLMIDTVRARKRCRSDIFIQVMTFEDIE